MTFRPSSSAIIANIEGFRLLSIEVRSHLLKFCSLLSVEDGHTLLSVEGGKTMDAKRSEGGNRSKRDACMTKRTNLKQSSDILALKRTPEKNDDHRK